MQQRNGQEDRKENKKITVVREGQPWKEADNSENLCWSQAEGGMKRKYRIWQQEVPDDHSPRERWSGDQREGF